MSRVKLKTFFTVLLLLLLIPAVVISGAIIFKGKHFAWISLCVAVLACLPVFYRFERRGSAKELTVLAVITALSVAGRFIFAWFPGFKPVAAITVIAGIYCTSEAGFLVGALSAVISNFYFGQGPWTPFQMLSWGIIGFLSGMLASGLKKSRIFLCVFGLLAGILFSLTMDIWTVLWSDGSFNLLRYSAYALSAAPTTLEYCISNIIFLLLLARPIGEKLERIKKKYGLFVKA